MGLFLKNLFGKNESKLEQIIYMADKDDPAAKRTLYELFESNELDSDRHNSIRKRIYLPLALKGDVEAQKWMGLLSLHHDNNSEESLMWYTKAAEQGDTEAMRLIALGHSDVTGYYGVNRQEEFKWYLRAAEAGDGDAQESVGREYSIGEVVTKDFDKMVYWYKKAIDSGYLPACAALAQFYEAPETYSGKYHNPEQAEKLYLKAMESHKEGACATAAASLGLIYGREFIFDKIPSSDKANISKALYWLFQAVWFDYSPAKEYIQTIYEKTGVRATDEELERWHQDFLARV